jgi:hypothetical protein
MAEGMESAALDPQFVQQAIFGLAQNGLMPKTLRLASIETRWLASNSVNQ